MAHPNFLAQANTMSNLVNELIHGGERAERMLDTMYIHGLSLGLVEPINFAQQVRDHNADMVARTPGVDVFELERHATEDEQELYRRHRSVALTPDVVLAIERHMAQIDEDNECAWENAQQAAPEDYDDSHVPVDTAPRPRTP